jgi:hypothetical protein
MSLRTVVIDKVFARKHSEVGDAALTARRLDPRSLGLVNDPGSKDYLVQTRFEYWWICRVGAHKSHQCLNAVGHAKSPL